MDMKKILFIILMLCLWLGAKSQRPVSAKPLFTHKGADIASASTLTLGYTGNYFDVTGTTTIDSIAPVVSVPGQYILLQFDGALTLTHSADIFLPTAANITTAAGDHASFYEYAAGQFRCVAYTRADGTALSSGGSVSISGTPANNQVAVWIDPNTIEGTNRFEFDGANILLDNNVTNDFATIANIDFKSLDNAAAEQVFGRIQGTTAATTTGSHQGQMNFYVPSSGSLTNQFSVIPSGINVTGDASVSGDLTVDSGTSGSGSVFGNATGGAQGAGTINSTGFYVNGNRVNYHYIYTGSTTDATANQVIGTYSANASELFSIKAKILGAETDATFSESIYYETTGVFYRESTGALTQFGSTTSDVTINPNFLTLPNFNISSNDLQIRVTGAASTNMDWIIVATIEPITIN